MVQSLLTSLSLTSFMTLASCFVNSEIFSTSNAASLTSQSLPRVPKTHLRPGTVIETHLGALGGADSSADFELEQNSRYLYIASYADSACATLYYGISEKLDSCTPLPNYYLRTAYHKYTITATGYQLSIYTDSNCNNLSKMEEFPFLKDCVPSTTDSKRYQKNFVTTTSVFPTVTQHVALR